MLNHQELHTLIEQARKGDTEAFGQLYKSFYYMVYYMILQKIKNHSDAEDVTQDVFLLAYKNISELKNNYNFLSWLKRICYNCCQDFLKSRIDTIIDEPDDILLSFEDPDLSLYPDFEFMKNEKSEVIMDAISNLSLSHQHVITMKYFSEMKISEIAKALNISEGTVKSRLNYSRKYLKKSLSHYRKSGFLQAMPIGVALNNNTIKLAKKAKPKPKIWPYVLVVGSTILAFGASVILAAMPTKTTDASPLLTPPPSPTPTVITDVLAPYVVDSAFSNNGTTIWLADDGTGVDFSSIRTECPDSQSITPLSSDALSGSIVLPPTDFTYTLYFSDLSGNIGHALVQPD